MTSNNHLLQNSNNYKENYTHNVCEIFIKYIAIINEYISQYFETIKITEPTYYNYVMCRGIETLCHVFKTILLYTKNLGIAYVQSQKALYYYTEFMCQIGDSSHSFLRLNSKDATLFVYKKTIFEMNNEQIKSSSCILGTCSITENINMLTDIYNKNIIFCINTVINSEVPTHTQTQLPTHATIMTKNKFLKYIANHSDELCKNLLNIYLDSKDKKYETKLRTIKVFNDSVISTTDTPILYVISFSEKLRTTNICEKKLTQKLNTQENFEKKHTLPCHKYTTWIFA